MKEGRRAAKVKVRCMLGHRVAVVLFWMIGNDPTLKK